MKPKEIELLRPGQKVRRKAKVQVEVETPISLSGDDYRYQPNEYRTEVRDLLYEVVEVNEKEAVCKPVGHDDGMVYIHPHSCDEFRRAK